MKKLFLIFLPVFLFKSLHAEIPFPLLGFLTNEMPSLEKYIPNDYSNKQIDLLIKRLTDLLVAKFQKEIAVTASFRVSELFEYLQKMIKNIKIVEDNGMAKNWRHQKELDLLKLKYSGKIRGDLIDLTYNNFILPMRIIENENDPNKLRLILAGVPMPREYLKANCLELTIDLFLRTLEIEWLGSAWTACPLPDKQAGTFLLNFAEDVANALHMEKIELIDESKIICPENQAEINFLTLRIFQGKEGWYASKKYFPTTNEAMDTSIFTSSRLSDLLKELAILDQEQIDNLIKKNLTNKFRLNYYNNYNKNRKFLLNQIRNYQDSNDSDRVADFMNWLYTVSCAKYDQAYNFLFPKIFTDTRFSISDYLPTGLRLMKKL